MKDDADASSPSAPAFQLWNEGRLEEAAALYRSVLEKIPADSFVLGQVHGELAAVLQELGDHAGALEHLQPSLEAALRSGANADADVVIARFFLADFLRRLGRPGDALAAIAPSMLTAAPTQWLLYLVKAEALAALGRTEDAAAAAAQALALAPNDAKRAELSARLAGGERP